MCTNPQYILVSMWILCFLQILKIPLWYSELMAFKDVYTLLPGAREYVLYVAKGTLQMWLRLETQRFSWIIRKPDHMSPSNWKAGRLVRKIRWGKKTQQRRDRRMTQLLLRTWKPQNAGGSASWGCFLAGRQPTRKLVLGCSFLQSQMTTVCQQHQCARLQTLPRPSRKEHGAPTPWVWPDETCFGRPTYR